MTPEAWQKAPSASEYGHSVRFPVHGEPGSGSRI